jgi:tungstate transport system permease protein
MDPAALSPLSPDLAEIVLLSLQVSLSAVLVAIVVGMPAGALLAVARFPGRRALILFINTLMGLPPVLVGLLVYLMVSRSGPLGALELLYTPTAMIIAQAILVTPIIISLTRQTIKDLLAEYDLFLRAHGLSLMQRVGALLYEGRFSLATAVLAGTGRAIAEVGAVMIVGGNINHVTRTMTTTIALETSKGNLDLAISLGLILLLIAISINLAVHLLRPRDVARPRRRWG